MRENEDERVGEHDVLSSGNPSSRPWVEEGPPLQEGDEEEESARGRDGMTRSEEGRTGMMDQSWRRARKGRESEC